MFNMVVTFREAGEFTVAALNRGSGCKGHDILEKTIKPSTLKSTYKLTNEQEKVIKDEDLMGIVGHLDKEKILLEECIARYMSTEIMGKLMLKSFHWTPKQ